jgi:hypothetical protein
MPPFLFVTTAFLIAAFLFICMGAWRVYSGRSPQRPLMERAAMAIICGVIGWGAMTWLRADHPTASEARVIVVWVELITAFGISVVMIAEGWLVHPQSDRK